MKLKIKDLSKEFFLHQRRRRIEGFRDVSFTVEGGECFGISGPSGSGKSSLLKCIYRTYISNKGDILFESRNGTVNLRTLPEYEIQKLRKSEIGYLSQFLRVVPRVSAIDVVAEPLINLYLSESSHDPAGLREKARAEAAYLLKKLLIPENLFDAFPSTFSGGEMQRVNLARALIAKYDLLLLDEPTASLDEGTKEIVIEMLRAEKERGATIICISHDASFLNALADRVGVMNRGRMVEVLEVAP